MDTQDEPGADAAAIEHWRHARNPLLTWCDELMPEHPPTGVVRTCAKCLARAITFRMSKPDAQSAMMFGSSPRYSPPA